MLRGVGSDHPGQRIWTRHPEKLQMRQFRAAHEKMQMALDEARKHTRPLRVNDGTVRACQCNGIAAKGCDPVAGKSHRVGFGGLGIHGEGARVDDQKGDGHLAP